MSELRVEVAENGFVVHDGDIRHGTMDRLWAFETPASLADFIKEWGEEKDRSNIGNPLAIQNKNGSTSTSNDKRTLGGDSG